MKEQILQVARIIGRQFRGWGEPVSHASISAMSRILESRVKSSSRFQLLLNNNFTNTRRAR